MSFLLNLRNSTTRITWSICMIALVVWLWFSGYYSQEAQLRVGLLASMEACHTGVIATDADARIICVNQSVRDLTGFAPGELPGMSLLDIMPTRVKDKHPSHFGTMKQGETIAFTCQLRRKDGGYTPVSIRARAASGDLFVAVIDRTGPNSRSEAFYP